MIGLLGFSPLARIGSGLIKIGLALVIVGAVFGMAIFLKGVGALETQRDVAVAANVDARETLDDVLAEVDGIRGIQDEQREMLAHVEADIADLHAAIARIDEDWLHTPIGEIVGEIER